MDDKYAKKVAEVNSQILTGFSVHNKYCDNCIWAWEDGLEPKDSFCGMYPVNTGIPKPNKVQFEGGKCDYYSPDITD